jgi:hypothetical protein
MKAQLLSFFAALFVFLASAQPRDPGLQDLAKVRPPIQRRMIPPGSEQAMSADGVGKESAPFHLRITSSTSHPHLALDAPNISGQNSCTLPISLSICG